ncbi:hypothetical protein [Nocardia sp. NPDC056000]
MADSSVQSLLDEVQKSPDWTQLSKAQQIGMAQGLEGAATGTCDK